MTVAQLETSMTAREMDEWYEWHRIKAEKTTEAMRDVERKSKHRR